MSEFNKVGSAAATTAMTLLPALLTFASLPAAKVRDTVYISTEAAWFTGAVTFGLSVRTVVTLADERSLNVADLCAPSTVLQYGT